MKQQSGELDGDESCTERGREKQSLKKDPTVTPEPTGRKGEKSVATAVVEAKLHLCDSTLWTARRMKWSHMSEEPKWIQIKSVTASASSL